MIEQLNLNVFNVSIIALADIVWIYYFFKCRIIEKRIERLEQSSGEGK